MKNHLDSRNGEDERGLLRAFLSRRLWCQDPFVSLCLFFSDAECVCHNWMFSKTTTSDNTSKKLQNGDLKRREILNDLLKITVAVSGSIPLACNLAPSFFSRS